MATTREMLHDTTCAYKEVDYHGIEYTMCKDYEHISRYRRLRQVIHYLEGTDRFMTLETQNKYSYSGVTYEYYTVTVDRENRLDLISYDYYNVTDAQIRKDHVFSTGFPRCAEKKLGFFEQEGLIFSSKKLLRDYITRQVKRNSRMVYFKLTGKLKARSTVETSTFSAWGGSGQAKLSSLRLGSGR